MFEEAIKVAKRGNSPTHKVGAVIYDRKGRRLSCGWNHLSERRLATTPRSMHAEHMALTRLPPNVKPYKIVVAVVTKGGNVTCGKPCPSCQNMLDKLDLIVEHTPWLNA